jgi:hypothetical protein
LANNDMKTERHGDAFEVRCTDGLFPHELIGVLIGYAHSRGFSVEHDGSGLTLYRKPAVVAAPAVADAASSAKVVSFANERLRRGG